MRGAESREEVSPSLRQAGFHWLVPSRAGSRDHCGPGVGARGGAALGKQGANLCSQNNLFFLNLPPGAEAAQRR